MPAPVRIAPGTRQDVGRVNHAIATVLGLAVGTGPPNVFTTLGRHRRLFRRWLGFAGALMPGGRLPRADSELLILRVAHLTASDYEWHQHERLGRAAGLSADEVERVRRGPQADGWSERQRALLVAADQLVATHDLDDAAFSRLSAELPDPVDVLEVTLLVGHYAMLAGTLNAARVPVDEPPSRAPRALRRVVQAAARRRGAA